ncbi:MAG: hypothetical protein H7Y04_14100, partial [Verrucomicrobia bacterium]|nr:hypothetical protein [Cytophagales bacterium]
FAVFVFAVFAFAAGFEELYKYQPTNNATTKTAPIISIGALLFCLVVSFGVFFPSLGNKRNTSDNNNE